MMFKLHLIMNPKRKGVMYGCCNTKETHKKRRWEEKEMIVNAVLLGLYIWLMRSRDGAIALICFTLSWVAFIYTQEPYLHHLAVAAVYCLCIFMRNIKTMFLMTIVATHQYIMAIDSILFPSTETILYGLYPHVALTLNIFILATIKRINDETASTRNNHHSIRGRTRVDN